MKQERKSQNKNRQSYNSYLKYSNIALQMGAIIGLGVWGGIQLDRYFELVTPVFTLVLSLLSVFVALYIIIKGVSSDD
jgi:F0F1-type ATP synthase assembly protein I